ncbi:MAG: M23 family metallopeptidase [Acidobacteria bacterium]|nr:M23 family metallopeptidase [Acidobacteriota bacterium]
MKRQRQNSLTVAALVIGFYLGATTDWWLRERVAPFLARSQARGTTPVAPTSGVRGGDEATPAPAVGWPAVTAPGVTPTVPARRTPSISSGLEEAVEELGRRDLRLPIDNVPPESFRRSFSERRDGRAHEAADMLAPRGTPVHAVEDGTIAKLFYSHAGGNTLYQFDPSRQFAYYYAHLDRYAPGLKEGQRVRRGDVIGFVGTSGNAPPNTPHLHFAVFELTPERRWWDGRAIDPYLVFSR